LARLVPYFSGTVPSKQAHVPQLTPDT